MSRTVASCLTGPKGGNQQGKSTPPRARSMALCRTAFEGWVIPSRKMVANVATAARSTGLGMPMQWLTPPFSCQLMRFWGKLWSSPIVGAVTFLFFAILLELPFEKPSPPESLMASAFDGGRRPMAIVGTPKDTRQEQNSWQWWLVGVSLLE